MKSFARTTKLPSIGGRAAYISDPGKQEEIVLESEKVNWQPYADYEATQHKTNVRQNEGREVMVTLPNSWYHLPNDELKSRIDTIAKKVVGDGREFQWAVHWNKSRTNFHVHIIFSERQKAKEVKVWDRDIYLTSDGKVARKKADRARDEHGNIKPPIHAKGEVKSDPFTAKDTKFKTKEWLHSMKQDLKQTMEQQWGVKFEKQPHLPEFHMGNGSDAPIIAKKNIVVRENNRRLDFLESKGVKITKLVNAVKEIRNGTRLNDQVKDQTPLIWQDKEGTYRVTVFRDPDRALFQMEQTMARFQEQPVKAAEPVQMAQNEPVAAVNKQEQPEKAAETLQTIDDANIELYNDLQIRDFVDDHPSVYETLGKEKFEKLKMDAINKWAVLQFEIKDNQLIVRTIPYENYQKALKLESLMSNLEDGNREANNIRSQIKGCNFFQFNKKKELRKELEERIAKNVEIRKEIQTQVPLPEFPLMEEMRQAIAKQVDQLKHPERYVEFVTDKEPEPEQPKQLSREEWDAEIAKSRSEINEKSTDRQQHSRSSGKGRSTKTDDLER